MSIHDGHRARMKERFLQEGLDNFSDFQVLEILLFYAIPRKDTNPIAHALMDHFGGLPQVLEATFDELCKVPGVTENAATLLGLTTAAGRVYQIRRSEQVQMLDTITKCGDYLKHFFFGRRNEMVYLLCLDAKCKPLCCRKVGEGSVNSANVPARRVVEIALGANATSVVLAHNHPSGLAIPSADDIATTRRLASALAAVEVQLVDHIVVADDDYVSMVQSGCVFDD